MYIGYEWPEEKNYNPIILSSKPKKRRIKQKGQNPGKEPKMSNQNTSAGKSRKKTPRLSNAEQEAKAAEQQRQMKQAIEETDIASKALKALQTADRKSAEHTYLAGKSLGKIKDGKLYRLQGCKSFKAFVGEKFKISEQYAYMLINAAKVWDILSKAGGTSKYISEKLLRKLTSLLHDENKVIEVWQAATKGKADKIPTDKELSDAVAASKPKTQTTDKSASEILNEPHADARAIINLLRRVVDGKIHLNDEDHSKLMAHIHTISTLPASREKNN